MPGFRDRPRVAVVDFDETTAFPGLHLEFTYPTLGEYVDLMVTGTDVETTTEPDGTQVQATREMRAAANHLRAWNVEDEQPGGGELEPTLVNLLARSQPLARAIIEAFIVETKEVPGPLDRVSTSGGTSVLALPMEPLDLAGPPVS